MEYEPPWDWWGVWENAAAVAFKNGRLRIEAPVRLSHAESWQEGVVIHCKGYRLHPREPDAECTRAGGSTGTQQEKGRLISKQRGFLELDLVLGNWVEENVNSMDENTVKSLIHVLDLENPDLWKWLTGQEQPPEIVSSNPVFLALHKKVMTNLNKHAAPKTRAEAGQPWVKGWDDFKRGRDAPISGNQ
ncbi:PREDICTED: succinate dehydrogenase assembly factor 2, mitochondrial-like [Brassica oleracea var. oleracea]|uniref:succinate dehydrogenase assembly factor 2, mitochondrial-like n=1 Tax=Brassica oleracea var. oleracea TaxID=109376 RepID=UPI0006A6B008|nr:PREDICTED: succinate dehydrogenase assembly factor 2, mitochondrial-like [Brassica oleracea var. oleracea]